MQTHNMDFHDSNVERSGSRYRRVPSNIANYVAEPAGFRPEVRDA